MTLASLLGSGEGPLVAMTLQQWAQVQKRLHGEAGSKRKGMRQTGFFITTHPQKPVHSLRSALIPAKGDVPMTK